MTTRKSEVSAGYSALLRDRRLTLADRTVAISDERFQKTPQQFEMEFLEKLLIADPAHEQALRILGHAYTEQGEYAKGLEMDQRLVRLCPKDAQAFYNLACSYSLLARLDEALETLKTALTLGFDSVRSIESDPDLANLRATAPYRQLISLFRNRLSGA
jgi:tetratricopeptide (TPR) repeat protein